ncbi:hypothetical protein ACFLVG_03225 [Chloroflexota bacterium]
MGEQTAWELVNPEGTFQLEPLAIKPHCEALEGKTVLLHWNRKHNGDIFLNKIADLLIENVKDVKITRGWEVAPETARVSPNASISKETAKKLANLKPDIVIASQGD